MSFDSSVVVEAINKSAKGTVFGVGQGIIINKLMDLVDMAIGTKDLRGVHRAEADALSLLIQAGLTGVAAALTYQMFTDDVDPTNGFMYSAALLGSQAARTGGKTTVFSRIASVAGAVDKEIEHKTAKMSTYMGSKPASAPAVKVSTSGS